MRTLEIPRPYLLFLGDADEPLGVKTALGLLEWRRDWCIGQYRLGPGTIDLGLTDMDPVAARRAGAATMVIGGTTFGGVFSPAWEAAVLAALDAGLNVASGMHDRLHAHPAFVERAQGRGLRLFDVRALPPGFSAPVGTGRKRTGRRVLTVGTDCAVGKKFTALSLERDLLARGVPATFRATGQTGVLISGHGVAIDAVVADFLSGVVELLSPDNAPDHWDAIEGQGSLLHPAYAAVSLGLLHGSQPDAVVLCHEAGRETVLGYPDRPIASLERCIELTLSCGRVTSPAIRVAGVSLNTARLAPETRADAIAAVEMGLGLPCVDPALTGTGPILDALLREGA